MDSSLLATKLHIPPPISHAVHRARLVDTLEDAIAVYKVVLLSAPAGYGKTSLLSQWAYTRPNRVAWLSIDEGDNDPERFFRYLHAAWAEVQPGIREMPLGLLLSAMDPDGESVLSAFINAAIDLPGHTVFVLDDIHLLTDPAIHTALTFLIDHLPPTLHFVLSGRAEPPLPLARYRARHELMEIRTEELQFSVAETEDFLGRAMGLNLSLDEITSLHARLEGWIAGLQLVSLTLRNRPHTPYALAVSGRHRFIVDYLSQDVFDHLPEDVQRFLLQTSILDRLCGSLCDAVAGTDGGQEMLEHLERQNVFLAALDVDRTWFRYQRLFAEFLHQELKRRQTADVPHLHRRAAGWFLAQELPEPAFSHAIQADDADLAIEILDRYLNIKLFGGELKTLEVWLNEVPARWYSMMYPQLGLARAGLLAYLGELDACVHCIDDVEQRLLAATTEGIGWQLARVTAFRCFVACFQNDLGQAEIHADNALRNLREDDLSYRADIFHALGDTYRGHGRWQEARASYRKVLDFSHVPAFPLMSVHVFGALADLELRQGRLRNAAGHWKNALAAIEEPESWGRLPLPVIGWVYLRIGELLYERNELTEASDHLSRGLERAELGGDMRSLIAGYIMTGRLKLAEGDVESAIEYLEQARRLVEHAPFPDWISRFERFQLELWLVQGKLTAIAEWADAMQRDAALEDRPDGETAQLALARVLIVRGDAPSRERALELLARLLRSSAEEGRIGVQVEALALQALSHWNGGDRARALISLGSALRLAEPEGYVRLFADLGLPMARLLQEAHSRAVMPDYVRRLLAACGSGISPRSYGAGTLPEPLSVREREVCKLIAAGLTNSEIAEALYISPQTVKKHTSSIYGKLGVSHRALAAARARELDLLD